MEPSRLLLYENGASLGIFPPALGGDDHEVTLPSVIVMEPEGACFTHIHQDGTCYRLLTDFCRRDLLPQLAAVANFRNAHSSRPYLSRRLHLDKGFQGTSTPPPSRRLSRLALWPERPPSSGNSKRCTVHADGRVEVRAAGGNARLVLSSSRNVCEVDFAAQIPATSSFLPEKPRDGDEEKSDWCGGWPGDNGATGCGQGGRRGACAGRVWVNRQFLVGRAAPPPAEFAHALGVALSAFPARGGEEDGENRPAAVGGEDEVVTSKLPVPLGRPDRARWDTVQTSQTFGSSPNAWASAFDPHRPLGEWTDVAYSSATLSGGDPANVTPEHWLLAADVMKLAKGTGFSGPLAAVVESFAGCIYRVVDDGEGSGVGSISGERGEGRGERGVTVHVVIEDDGTEVSLDGDFVRVLHASVASPARRPRDRLLHVSATSTVYFRVAKVPETPVGLLVSCNDGDSSSARGWRNISLGDITSRAASLRRQYLVHRRCSNSNLISGIHEGGEKRGGRVGTLDSACFWVERAAPEGSGVLPPTAEAATVPASAFGVTSPPQHKPYLSADVLWREERGGASFVAFADGRARGVFSDRTIVTLGAPFPKAACGMISHRAPVCGAAIGVGRFHSGPGEGEEKHGEVDRNVECVLPDGTVRRFSLLSMSREEAFSNRQGGAISGNRGLVPCVAAVRRFEVRARANPAERRASAAREEAVRLAASVELDQNRRFIALHQLMRRQARPDCRGTQSAVAAKTRVSSLQRSEGGSWASTPYQHRRREEEKDQEYLDRRRTEGVVVRGRAPTGDLERNALVERVLEANLKVLLGQTRSYS